MKIPPQCETQRCSRPPYARIISLKPNGAHEIEEWYCQPCHRVYRKALEVHPNDATTDSYA